MTKLNKRGVRVSQEEFDKALDACINTPPLRYKDLKARLKREREEKAKFKQGS